MSQDALDHNAADETKHLINRLRLLGFRLTWLSSDVALIAWKDNQKVSQNLRISWATQTLGSLLYP